MLEQEDSKNIHGMQLKLENSFSVGYYFYLYTIYASY